MFFKKLLSKFSIDQTYCFTDRKCDKNLGYNLPGSIGAGSIEIDFRSIEPNFRLIKIRSDGFFKSFFSHVFFTLFNFSKSFLLSLFDQSTSNLLFVVFFLIFLKGFCLQVSVCPFYPFLFFLFTYFMHFRCNFRTYWILGFLIFGLFSFKLNHWVFVFR